MGMQTVMMALMNANVKVRDTHYFEGGKGLFSYNVFCHFYFTCSRENIRYSPCFVKSVKRSTFKIFLIFCSS